MSRTRTVSVIALAAIGMAAILVLNMAQPGRGHEGPDDPPRAGVRMPDHPVEYFIELGLDDTQQVPWAGEVSVTGGKILLFEIIEASNNSKVEGSTFDVRVKRNPANAQQPAAKKGKKKQAKKATESGFLPVRLRLRLDAPPTATVEIRPKQGAIAFAVADLKPGDSKEFLGGAAEVERVEVAMPLTGKETDDDFPALAKAADGSLWLAYVEYRSGPKLIKERALEGNFDPLAVVDHGDQIKLQRFDGRAWSAPVDVTEAKLDIWRPTIAVDGRGGVNVIWTQKKGNAWDLYSRRFTPSAAGKGTWSPVQQITNSPGADFQVTAVTDSSGKVWIAWQAWTGTNYDILLASQNDAGNWNPAASISTSQANDWNPSIAADKVGNVYVVWDTYDQGNYDVQLYTAGKASKTITVANSPRFEARSVVHCDADNRVWVAYEEGNEQWGKDYASTSEYAKVGFTKNAGYALYVDRTVRLKCLADGVWKQPAADLEKAFADELARGRSVPRLTSDAKGGLWLLVRHHPRANGQGESWQSFALRYDGSNWASPVALVGSVNVIDNRPALAATEAGIVTVFCGDDRTQGTQSRDQADLYMMTLKAESPAKTPELIAAAATPAAEMASVHPKEVEDVARIRGYRVTAGGKEHRLLRGEFHRHTEFTSHRDQDGLLEDSLRYAHDAVDHDWMGNGDHDNGQGFEYQWWLIQKTFDIHHHPSHFIGAMTYERSVVFPDGHRNVMMPVRGVRPLPRGDLKNTSPEKGTADTKMLYAYLRHFGGICASHTSATNMGTDWRDNDPEVEPVVEIYQGHRHNYEHFGAPRSPTQETNIGGYQPSGFIWNALEKGYRLGFESSSDHVSTHLSYAIVIATEQSRQGLIDAMKQRHCYAATDNIVLMVRSGDHLMGDVFTTKEKPTLAIEVQGTTPVSKLHVVRDNKYVYTVEPGEQTVRRTFTDMDAQAGKSSYYYVRVEQADGNLAWASPMWITYQP